MHPLKLFDLHCDTASLLFDRKQSLAANDLHIDLDKANSFDTYIQTMAVWSNYRLSDEAAWERFWDIRENLLAQLDAYRIPLIKNSGDLSKAAENKRGAILAVEDARLLAGHPERLDILHDCGVRFLTLTWSGETCIGGAHNTNSGLTVFGRAMAEEALERGMILDISHA
ncbi:MAG: membrane dipeptidase, partial [Clostridia bacterium]|nr:membrane dipeptidase [Clostridia bacterium]